jgi:putative heme-binding domain-containing protein
MKRIAVTLFPPATIGVLWTALVLAGAPVELRAQTTPQYAPADIQYGSRIFAAQCTVCHGATGDLVPNVDLKSGRLPRAATDGQLRALVTSGIPGTAMPAFKFDASELTMLVAYVRNMRNFDAQSVALGDAGRGRTVFEGNGGCATCHRVNGKGPRVAPDLSEIGTQRGADALQRSLLAPNDAILPTNRYVRAVTADGKTISGRRLNEDTFTVQLIDEQERLVSLTKADLRQYAVVMTSPMPSFKDKLSEQNLADVVAYLLSLKGVQ